jgi:hypothetical protein
LWIFTVKTAGTALMDVGAVKIGATKLTPQLIIHPGSFDANPVQEEVNGSLSMPLLGFRVRCDAVECEALGMPENKIEEHVRREFRVIYPDLTAGGGLTQYI